MTSDGTYTYERDAENRLIKINYPGIGNNSKFGYDPKGQNVQIAETKMSALVSNSEIIWSRGERCESRDAMNGASSKYFSRGQVDSTVLTTASKFRFFDALGSIRSITDASGSEVSALDYSPFGVPQLVLGSYMSEFQFAGYFFHSPSSLDFALYRVYSPSLGRWLSRDPLRESGGVNLYSYAFNSPIDYFDASGLFGTPVRGKVKKRKCFHSKGCYGRCCEFYELGAITKKRYKECLDKCDDGFPNCPYAYSCSCACWWLYEVLNVISDQEYRGCLARCKTEYNKCEKTGAPLVPN